MGGSDSPSAGLKFANHPMASQQQKPMVPGLVKPSAGLKFARPPHPQDSLSYTSERLPKAQQDYSDAKKMLQAWRKLEERLAAAADARARLRRIERVAMQKLGLSIEALPPDYSDDEPEEKTKKLADVVVVPRPSKSRKLE